MRRLLEAAVVVAALAIGVFVAYQWRARQALASAEAESGLRPGADVENPGAPAPKAVPEERGVTGTPMIRLTTPPRRSRRGPVVPPPSSGR